MTLPDIDIRTAAVTFLAIVISLTVHEFAHAFTADRLGDDTPRRHGRLTLNPIVLFRAYPFGSLVVPLIGAFSGFLAGWAATPVNPSRVRRTISVRTADILITIAGPLSNVLLAMISTGLFALLMAFGAGQAWAEPLISLTTYLVLSNVFIAMFNLVPIPPLDGFQIVRALAPESGLLRFLQQYQLFVLILFIFYAGRLFHPVIGAAMRVLATVAVGVTG
ncbi:MAG: site-2 protease family protein [Myxococcales bacterium]|nr:site-2 protease family protein [Myxococcales bacterium]